MTMHGRTARPHSTALASLSATVLAVACASGGSAPPQSITRVPIAYEQPLPPLAPLEAHLRLAGSESTWVAQGPGFELRARSRPDMPRLNTTLQQLAEVHGRAFGSDPALVIVTIRRLSREGQTVVPAPTVTSTTEPVVEVTVGPAGDPVDEATLRMGLREAEARGGEADRSGRGGANRGQGLGGVNGIGAPGTRRSSGVTRPAALGTVARVERAWLSARATALTGTPATDDQRAGLDQDPRVPAWAEEAIASLAADSQTVNYLAARLAPQIDSLYPLERLLTMRRPAEPRPVIATQGADSAGRRGGAADGGAGRRGGMEGRRAGGGGGGGGGFGYGSFGVTLRGAALFDAEAEAVGQYLASREGPRIIGAMVDSQIMGKPAVSALAGARMLPAQLPALEAQWQKWLDYRARGTSGGGPTRMR